MKKVLLVLTIGILIQTNLCAQSLQLMKKDGSAIINDTILISTSNDTSSIITYVYIKNNSTKTLDVKIKAYAKTIVSGSGASYCWSTGCFDVTTTSPDIYKTINSADTAKEFHSDLSPNKFQGVSEIMYTFYNKNSTTDSVSFTVFYEVIATGIDKLDQINKSIKSYPNPVNDYLNFDYNLGLTKQGKILIYDLIGKKVKQKNINNSENYSQVNVSDLNPGMYIWTVEIDGIPIKSNKLIKR